MVWGLEYARRVGGAWVVVVHVVHDPAGAPGFYAEGGEWAGQGLPEQVAARLLEEFLAGAAQKRPELVRAERYETRIVAGLPATRVIEVAEGLGAQLIVVGSAGRSGLSKLLLGSQALRIAQLSPIPVTVVKAEEAPEDRA